MPAQLAVTQRQFLFSRLEKIEKKIIHSIIREIASRIARGNPLDSDAICESESVSISNNETNRKIVNSFIKELDNFFKETSRFYLPYLEKGDTGKTISYIYCILWIQGHIGFMDRVPKLDDRQVMELVSNMLSKALADTNTAEGNRALRLVMERAVSLLNQQLHQNQPLQAEENLPTPTTFPETPPLRWSDRKKFRLEDITDPFLRAKLETTPQLVQQLRELKPEDGGLTFLDIVYSDYIQAGFGKKELRKIDKTIFNICEKSSGYGQYLPNKQMQIDKKVREQDFANADEKKRAYMALKKREQRQRQIT